MSNSPRHNSQFAVHGPAVIARRAAFSAAHRYVQPKFSHLENQQVFGLCYLENGHGHNYVVEAFVQGAIDAKTGLVVDVIEIDKVLKNVLQPLDHRHLNEDVAFFRHHIPTTENLALYLFTQVQGELSGLHLQRLRVFETNELWAEVWA